MPGGFLGGGPQIAGAQHQVSQFGRQFGLAAPIGAGRSHCRDTGHKVAHQRYAHQNGVNDADRVLGVDLLEKNDQHRFDDQKPSRNGDRNPGRRLRRGARQQREYTLSRRPRATRRTGTRERSTRYLPDAGKAPTSGRHPLSMYLSGAQQSPWREMLCRRSLARSLLLHFCITGEIIPHGAKTHGLHGVLREAAQRGPLATDTLTGATIVLRDVRPNATLRASRWGSINSPRQESIGVHRSCSPAKANSISDSTPVHRATLKPAARSVR